MQTADKIIVTIIIITYNSSAYIYNCLDSLMKLMPGFGIEIIIIDNNSDDDTSKIIKSVPYQIKFIQNNVNKGFARACNQGIKTASGEYIFLLNPDTVILNDVISIFISYMEKQENLNVWCGGAQLYDDDKQPSKSYGKFPTIIDVLLEQSGVKGLLLKLPEVKKSIRQKQIKHNKEVPFVMGSGMFIRRSTLKHIGFFNEKFFLNYEETELSWRANRKGFKSIILPEAKILHHSGKSFSNLHTYLSHLWLGQLIFFRLTKSIAEFKFIRFLHLTGSFFRWLIKSDQFYLEHIKKIKLIN